MDLQPVRIYTADAVFDGWVAPEGQRMTDLLQQGPDIAVLPQGADRRDADAWIRMETNDMLLVVPPPHVSPPERRVARDQREVRLRVAGFQVIGTAHLKPGLEHDPYTRVTRPFLPLTAAIVLPADGSQPTACDVVIVNLRWAEFIDT